MSFKKPNLAQNMQEVLIPTPAGEFDLKSIFNIENRLNDVIKKETSLKNTSDRKTMINFTFDDATTENYTLLKPIFDKYGYKFSTPVILDFIGESDGSYLGLPHILEMQSEGFEFMAHTSNGAWRDTLIANATDEYFEYELGEVKKRLETKGIKIESFAWPRGHYTERAIEIAKKYYRSSVSIRSGYNIPPIETHEMYRMGMSASGGFKTLEQYKAMVDKAITDKSALLFYSHGNEYTGVNTNQLQILDDLLNYINSLDDVDVVNMTDILDVFENKVDIGRKSGGHFIIGSNGEISSSSLYSKMKPINITPITEFPQNIVTTTVHSIADVSGFPLSSGAGTLETYRLFVTDDLSFQIFYGFDTNTFAKRTWNMSVKAWNSWSLFQEASIKITTCVITAPQTLTNSVETDILVDSIQNINNANFCILENGKIKITKTGVYDVIVNVVFANNSTGTRQIELNANYVNSNAVNGLPTRLQLKQNLALNANSLLNIKAFQNSGGNLNLTQQFTKVSIRQIGAL